VHPHTWWPAGTRKWAIFALTFVFCGIVIAAIAVGIIAGREDEAGGSEEMSKRLVGRKVQGES
jgi:hypothetical protein